MTIPTNAEQVTQRINDLDNFATLESLEATIAELLAENAAYRAREAQIRAYLIGADVLGYKGAIDAALSVPTTPTRLVVDATIKKLPGVHELTPCEDMDKYDAKKLETKCVWSSELKRWVCKFCGEQPNTFYVVTGHDHTDDSIWWCDCRRKT